MVPSLLLRTLLFLAAVATVSAQESAIRIATYNLLKYPDAQPAARNVPLRTVVEAMRPHLIVAQEVESAAGVSIFLNDVLDRVFDGRFGAAPFLDVSSDTEGAFFYDTTRIVYLGMEVIRTQLRGIFGYRFTVIGTSDTVWIYTLHLKASDTQADAAQRAEEAGHLRRHLDSARAGRHVIVAGDFNVYRGTEPAFLRLTGEEGNAQTRLIDPLASTGNWHNNRDFAWLHTQSPRVRQFGGGVTGGLDDRFDMILVSRSLSSVINRASYTAFGNDGQHFNDSINRPPNLAVPQHVAQALHDASDHLPVYMDFNFGVASAPFEPAIAGLRVAPNPATERVSFELAPARVDGQLVISDMGGVEVARLAVERGASSVAWDCRTVPSGQYTYSIELDGARSSGTIAVVH